MTQDPELTVTILGSGTSTGVPMPGCSCAVCQSTDPRNARLRPSALITWGTRHILIDTGPDFRQQALREKISSVDAVLYTHAHADHILGIDDLRCYNFKQTSSIPCFGSPETLAQIRRIFFYVFERDPNYKGGGISQLTMHPITNFIDFELFDLRVTPFPVHHGGLTVTGYRFGNFAYATDCHELPETTEGLLSGTEVMVLDGLRHQPHQTHMTIEEAIETGKRLRLKKLYLIHMSHSVDHATVASQLPDWVELCWDGLTIPLKLS